MIVMVCVDDKNGMMFNKRRQSQDRVLRQHMLELAGDKKLWMNAYSRNGNFLKKKIALQWRKTDFRISGQANTVFWRMRIRRSTKNRLRS